SRAPGARLPRNQRDTRVSVARLETVLAGLARTRAPTGPQRCLRVPALARHRYRHPGCSADPGVESGPVRGRAAHEIHARRHRSLSHASRSSPWSFETHVTEGWGRHDRADRDDRSHVRSVGGEVGDTVAGPRESTLRRAPTSTATWERPSWTAPAPGRSTARRPRHFSSIRTCASCRARSALPMGEITR